MMSFYIFSSRVSLKYYQKIILLINNIYNDFNYNIFLNVIYNIF